MKREEKNNADPTSERILIDETAISESSGLPAFLAKPDGAPVYYGFPLVPESLTDGWYLGAITEYEDPDGCEEGDAFVVAPDGSRAGLVWNVGEGKVEQISGPDGLRWGVFQVWFSRPVHTTEDLVNRFREVLPQLKRIHEQLANDES